MYLKTEDFSVEGGGRGKLEAGFVERDVESVSFVCWDGGTGKRDDGTAFYGSSSVTEPCFVDAHH